jgi:hypothetical protein
MGVNILIVILVRLKIPRRCWLTAAKILALVVPTLTSATRQLNASHSNLDPSHIVTAKTLVEEPMNHNYLTRLNCGTHMSHTCTFDLDLGTILFPMNICGTMPPISSSSLPCLTNLEHHVCDKAGPSRF